MLAGMIDGHDISEVARLLRLPQGETMRVDVTLTVIK
jgi:hypothetical protein